MKAGKSPPAGAPHTDWSDAHALRQQVQKWWQKGELLASVVSEENAFPRRLVLKVPTSGDVSNRFDEVRLWIAALKNVPHVRLEWRDFTHRQLGSNRMPDQVWLDTLDDACALIGMRRELGEFRSLLKTTAALQPLLLPLLLPWLARRPLRALELAPEWPLLLSIVQWLQQHPRPAIYLRQVDLPGVHSKLIESRAQVLAELLDLALPPAAINHEVGSARFAARYGFLDKPLLVRMRVLDPALLAGAPGVAGAAEAAGAIDPATRWGSDITLDAAHFAQLDLRCKNVFITENEINFLAFPPVAHSLLVFGAGYGFEALRQASWLANCRVFYWGDIDTHGFAILDQLRSQLPGVESLLMDLATLLAHKLSWGVEDKPTTRELPRLTAAESALYNDLRDNRLQKQLRLEQERIGFGWLEQALAQRLNRIGQELLAVVPRSPN